MTERVKWEYRIEKSVDGAAETRLSEVGANGWELVAVVVQFTTHYAYMKRKVRA